MKSACASLEQNGDLSQKSSRDKQKHRTVMSEANKLITGLHIDFDILLRFSVPAIIFVPATTIPPTASTSSAVEFKEFRTCEQNEPIAINCSSPSTVSLRNS